MTPIVRSRLPRTSSVFLQRIFLLKILEFHDQAPIPHLSPLLKSCLPYVRIALLKAGGFGCKNILLEVAHALKEAPKDYGK
ncbi:MAG: hypothetical protein A2Y62_02085 [Candidatus Fischerbacteria bacterium RBG_13_37_8]|uniref:Uncharacterized protein n=1 Tax=Candidatus Fischerbacteria bacterium RBG_13_37_8 TaxID=1817863 RepID=A0A1F5VJL5_9BACT|nr:MAG: hypothetical protein A2Y62_02085 [Candidatus Fischerbacteria bacterium RBG_13_37_8]